MSALVKGEQLIDYLQREYPWVVDYALTSKMESFLDSVVEGKETWQRFCRGVHAKMGMAKPPVRSAGGGENTPTAAQIKYAEGLSKSTGIDIPVSVRQSKKEISEWINKAKGVKT